MTGKDYTVIASALRDAYQKEEMNNKYAVQGEPARTNMQALVLSRREPFGLQTLRL